MYTFKPYTNHQLSQWQIYGQMRSTVEQLSWVERLYPSNLAKGVAGSLESVSEWLKTSQKTTLESTNSAHSESQRYIK